MRARLTTMLVATAMLAAACGPGEAATPESSTTSPPTTQTPKAEAVAFSYSYEPGDHHDYAFALDQSLQMTVAAEGEDSLFGEELPEAIDIITSIAGTVSYDIAAGPEPGTHEVSISGVFDQLEINGTVDGAPLEEGMIEEGTVPDLVEVPDLTIIIDDHGQLVSVGGKEIPEDFPFLGDPFSRLGDFTSGGLNGHFGPAFPDQPLAVGDTWSFSHSEQIEELDTVVSADTTYEVTGTGLLHGLEVAEIEFATKTSEVVLDLGGMFQAFFEAFGELGREPGDAPKDSAMETPEITFLITVAPSAANGKVWFAQEAGIVVKSSQDTTTSIAMLMDFSDGEGTVSTSVTMDLDMQLEAELLEGPSA